MKTVRLTLLGTLSALSAICCFGCERSAPIASPTAAPPSTASPPSRSTRPLTRLVYQDHVTQSLKWFDVEIDSDRQLSHGPVSDVSGFKSLDASRQKLVQMRAIDSLLLVGVRDDDEGQFESGWVLVDSGVRHHDHGDHSHWSFKGLPSVRSSRLDKQQGNPAHLYVYDGRFFLANDRLQGYTRIDPADFLQDQPPSAALEPTRFIKGGGNHITLAVAEDRVGYSSWIDGGGPNRGRIDVTPIATAATTAEPAYQLTLPTGGIHGAIVNSGRVFLAPSDGICWLDVDLEARLKPEEVTINHISLGAANDKPRRTGAFCNHGRNVLFVTGKEADAQLVFVDSSAPIPSPAFIKIEAKAGFSSTTPVTTTTASGQSLAFIFQDHLPETDGSDALIILDLDPNADGAFTDARILKSLPIGPSAVEGHYGHHDIAFDADRQFAFVANPGDGTVTVLSLKTLEIGPTFSVGGKPSDIVAIGGREIRD